MLTASLATATRQHIVRSVMRADPNPPRADSAEVRDRLASVRPPVTTGIARINYVRPTPLAPYGWPVDPDSDAELGERVPKVRVDRVQRQVKVFGHLPVGGALRNQADTANSDSVSSGHSGAESRPLTGGRTPQVRSRLRTRAASCSAQAAA